VALVDQGLFTEIIVDHGFGTVDTSSVVVTPTSGDDGQGVAVGAGLIRATEAFEAHAYPDPGTGGDPWTIGWGFTWYEDGSKVKSGDTMTQAEGDVLLERLITNKYLPGQRSIPAWSKLTANQKGALLSFAWNLSDGKFYRQNGFNTVSAALREERFSDVPRALMLYHNPNNSRVRVGLSIRRRVEGLVWSGSSIEAAFARARSEIKHYDDVQRFL
jgi:GH24 family phage-related lysozyme (muramidase)